MEDNKFEYSFETPCTLPYTEADSVTAYEFWNFANYTYTIADTTTTTTVPAMFDFTCSCCGKKFKTRDPLQDLCMSCLVEVVEFASNLD